MLDVVFALDRVADIIKSLEVDEPLQAIPFGEAADESGTDEIIRHACVEDAVGAIGQDVNIAASHAEILQDVDGRDEAPP